MGLHCLITVSWGNPGHRRWGYRKWWTALRSARRVSRPWGSIRCTGKRGRGPVPAGGADSVGAHHVHVWTRPVQGRRPVSRQGAVCPLWFIACGGPGSPVACRPGSSDELERALPAVHRGIPVPPQAVTSSSRSRCPGASASGACRWQSTRGARLWTAAGERGSLPLQA